MTTHANIPIIQRDDEPLSADEILRCEPPMPIRGDLQQYLEAYRERFGVVPRVSVQQSQETPSR